MLVRDDGQLLPLVARGATASRWVLHDVPARDTHHDAGSACANTLGRSVGQVRMVVLHPDDPFVDPAHILPQADSSEIVLMASYIEPQRDVGSVAGADGLGAVVNAIRQRGQPVIMIRFGNPTLGTQVPQFGSYLFAWNGCRASQVAGARAVLGLILFDCYIPITMSPAGAVPAGGTPR